MDSEEQEPLDAHYRDNLLEFDMRAQAILEPMVQIIPSWHHLVVCHALLEAYSGQYGQLVINQPPKTMKTHLVSISAVAWRLIRNPEMKFAIICYDEVLASKIVRTIREIMKSNWYLRLAPATRIKDEKNTETLFETTAGGTVQAFSINGGITGHGFDVIIIDDPQKA